MQSVVFGQKTRSKSTQRFARTQPLIALGVRWLICINFPFCKSINHIRLFVLMKEWVKFPIDSSCTPTRTVWKCPSLPNVHHSTNQLNSYGIPSNVENTLDFTFCASQTNSNTHTGRVLVLCGVAMVVFVPDLRLCVCAVWCDTIACHAVVSTGCQRLRECRQTNIQNVHWCLSNTRARCLFLNFLFFFLLFLCLDSIRFW